MFFGCLPCCGSAGTCTAASGLFVVHARITLSSLTYETSYGTNPPPLPEAFQVDNVAPLNRWIGSASVFTDTGTTAGTWRVTLTFYDDATLAATPTLNGGQSGLAFIDFEPFFGTSFDNVNAIGTFNFTPCTAGSGASGSAEIGTGKGSVGFAVLMSSSQTSPQF